MPWHGNMLPIKHGVLAATEAVWKDYYTIQNIGHLKQQSNTMTTFNRDTAGAQVVEEFGSRATGKTIVITGTTDGSLGAETAIALAHAAPAQLILLSRSQKSVDPVIQKIGEINPSIRSNFVSISLDDFDSIHAAATSITNQVSQIDILINCAGVMGVPWKLSKHNIESHFAINHVGHFLFTSLLYPLIAAAGPEARIVNYASDGYMLSPCRFEDYNFRNGAAYHPWAGYGQSKTANILFTRGLAKRGVRSYAVHPGVIMDTGLSNNVPDGLFVEARAVGLRETGVEFMMGEPKSMRQGVATGLVAALDPRLGGESGAYFEDAMVKEVREYASSEENVERLWRISEELVGRKFEI
jgi:NAD(P)-dependent dehydrogenase (short-subunit alcohol dehydrogenase family)